MRFLRLAYLLDFIAVDSIGKMVMSSLQGFMQMLYGGKLETESRRYQETEETRVKSLDLPKGL